MKKYLKYTWALFLAVSLANAEETKKPSKPVNLDLETVVWLYEAHAELPTSPKKLAGFVSADHINASDEFEKNKL